jgi:hypothetical protein
MTEKEPERYYDWMIWKLRQVNPKPIPSNRDLEKRLDILEERVNMLLNQNKE